MSTKPNDPFGRRLLTVVGLLLIACGAGRLWLANGTAAALASGIPLIAIGVCLTVIAAFFTNAGGTIKYLNFEIWFGEARRSERAKRSRDLP